MRPGAEAGHRAKIFLRGQCEPVKPDAKEALVECRYRLVRCAQNIFVTNRTRRSNVPRVLAPFLQEIWVTLRLLNDQVDSPVLDLCPFIFGWSCNGLPRVLRTKWSDLQKI